MTADVAIANAAAATRIDAGLLRRIAEVESSCNPAAHKPGSKYFGLFQLSQAEFLEFGGGDIFDAADNAMAAARLLRGIGDRWENTHGEAVTPFELYMIHQQGWSGFHALSAAPGSPAWLAIRSYYESDERAQLAISGNLPEGLYTESLTSAGFLDIWRKRLGLDEPTWLTAARRELGVKEAPGASDNARVVAYYRDAGHAEIAHDETAWCAAFVGAMLKRSGVKPSGSLMARSYLKWGMRLESPRPGCVVVFWRGDPESASGHVGFFTGYTTNGDIMLLGGNQSDAVNIAAQPKSRVLGYRWPTSTPTTKETPLAERFKDFIADFAPLTPLLARVIGGPLGSIAAAVLTDVIDKSGKRSEGEAPDATLKRLGVGEALPILRAAETALEAVGAVVSPAVPQTVPAPAPEGAQPAAPLTPELTVLDKLLGFTGYKTYIVLFLAAVVNVAAGLGVLPTLLTPETLTAINTALAALGGATLISKVERYAKVATSLLGRK